MSTLPPDDEAPLPGTAALPDELAPARDLWPDLAARLAAEPRPAAPPNNATPPTSTPWWAPERWAGWLRLPTVGWAGAAAAAAALVVMLARPAPVDVEAPGVPSTPPAAEEATRSPPDDLQAAFQAYREATRRLEAALEARRSEIDPAVWSTLEEQLHVVDRAIDDVERALEAPGDPDPRLLGLALSAWGQKVAVLQQALEVSQRG